MQYTREELEMILDNHRKWLEGKVGGVRADLRGANLCEADLCEADLCGANLCGADLCRANLCGADLREADLRGAKEIPFIPQACPDTGSFIAWKKVKGNYIVKLLISEDARRSSSTGRKCRTDKASVLAIETLDGKIANVQTVYSLYDSTFSYTIGEMVVVNNFCEDRFQECAPGIHFFINRQEAVNYEC